MHIVFVVDTSASMNQRVAGGITILDCAKAAIEHFVKVRARDQYAQASGDKYFLLTTDEHPTNGIKIGWKENLVQSSSTSTNFLQEVKNIVAKDFTNIGLSIKRAFDVINMYRLQNNVDNYAQGRFPSLIEPAVVILLTDGGHLSTSTGYSDSIIIPSNIGNNNNNNNSLLSAVTVGNELTSEIYRWDQRLYSFVLNYQAGYLSSNITSNSSATTNSESSMETSHNNNSNSSSSFTIANGMKEISESTGGDLFIIENMRNLLFSIDSLVFSKLSRIGFMARFQSLSASSTSVSSTSVDSSNFNFLSFVYLGQNVIPSSSGGSSIVSGGSVASSYWPIPESYLPNNYNISGNTNSSSSASNASSGENSNSNSSSSGGGGSLPLPPRTAHPVIICNTKNEIGDSFILENFPYDKYEIDPSSPFSELFGSKQSTTPNTPTSSSWYVYIRGSSGNPNSNGDPFGFIKYSSTTNSAYLYVLPYNFPKLWPLLDELINTLKNNPNLKWKQEFERYLNNIPSYYIPPLRNALKRLGIGGNVIPENIDGSLNYSIANYLKKLKNLSKMEIDRFTYSFSSVSNRESSSNVPSNSSSATSSTSNSSSSSTSTSSFSFHQLLDKGTRIEKGTLGMFSGDLNTSNVPGDKVDTGDTSNSNLNGSSTQSSNSNLFDLSRNNLLDHMIRWKSQILDADSSISTKSNLIESEAKHNLPVSKMGEYLPHIMKTDAMTLRDIHHGLLFDDTTGSIVNINIPNFQSSLNRSLFGNPFRSSDKATSPRFVDEAEEEGSKVYSSSNSSTGSISGKRKRSHSQSSVPPPNTLKRRHSITGSTPSSSSSKDPNRGSRGEGYGSLSAPSSPVHSSSSSSSSSSSKISESKLNAESDSSPINSPSSPSTKERVSPMDVDSELQAHHTGDVNNKIKAEIIKLVRKPGKNTDEIIAKLKLLQGDKQSVINEITMEAKRLKKQQLITLLESFQ